MLCDITFVDKALFNLALLMCIQLMNANDAYGVQTKMALLAL